MKVKMFKNVVRWMVSKWSGVRGESRRTLVFPKGTIVKFDGIPCELLHDTPYESAHFRAASKKEDEQ